MSFDDCDKKYLSEKYFLEEKELFDLVGLLVDQERVRRSIIVKKAHCYIHYAMYAIFASKECLVDNYVPSDFSFRRNEVYTAEYLLKGLRVSNEQDFSYFLYFLFLRQVVTEEYKRRKDFHFWLSIIKVIEQYIYKKYRIVFRGTIGAYNGIPTYVGGGEEILFDIDESIEAQNKIELSCRLSTMFWLAIFSSQGLYAFNSDNADCFGKDYYEYVIFNNLPCVFNEKSSYTVEYIPINLKIASKKYSQDDINKGDVVHLDGDTRNLNEDNIVLFRTKEDYIRYKDGSVNYQIDYKKIYFTNEEVTQEQFKRLYYNYSVKKLMSILKKNQSQIHLLVKKYSLPTKTELHKLTYEEYLAKY